MVSMTKIICMVASGTLVLLAGAAAHSRQQRYAGQSGEAQSTPPRESEAALLPFL